MIEGGRGADTFLSSAGAGLDLVTDFNPGEGDRIKLNNGAPFSVSQEGAGAVIHMQGRRLVL